MLFFVKSRGLAPGCMISFHVKAELGLIIFLMDPDRFQVNLFDKVIPKAGKPFHLKLIMRTVRLIGSGVCPLRFSWHEEQLGTSHFRMHGMLVYRRTPQYRSELF